MKTMKVSLLVVTVLALVSVAPATRHLVPDWYLSIQDAVNAATSGDTISVWGPPPGQDSPPYVYGENVDFNGKSLVVASRCFLPGWQGCQPTWDSVVIDGSNQAGPVVTMTGSESAVPRVVLKGFTITGRGSTFGGGIYCQDVVAVTEKNYVHDCVAGTSGGGVCHWHRYNNSDETLLSLAAASSRTKPSRATVAASTSTEQSPSATR